MKIFQGALALLAVRVTVLSISWQADVVQAADDGIQVHPTFERPADNVFEGSGEVRHIVCPGNANGKAAALQSASKFHLETKRGCMALTMNSAKAAALAKNKNIDLVEIDQKRYPMGRAPGPGLRGSGGDAGDFRKRPSRGDGRRLSAIAPYGLTNVQADKVTMGSGPAKVCIIDSGYDMGHPDLPTTGVTFDTNSPTPADTDGCSHGTHVAGTIAAVNNTVGVIGVAPGVELHIVKVFADTCAWSYASQLVGALEACVDEGAKVVSMSLGCSGAPCASTTEENAFDTALAAGVLSIAAAGNDGNTQMSYPASYDSVVSVAATDSSNTLASFSQRNSQVELAAPGVSVLSTVKRGTGTYATLDVDGQLDALGMTGSPAGTVTAPLFRCDSVNGLGSPGDCAGATGKVCLIQRGDITFAEKVVECEAGGGVAAVVYNNVAGPLSGTLGNTAGLNLVPAVGISQTDGAMLLGKIGTNAIVAVENNADYAFYDGTSMATPHVSGVAALVWSHCSDCTATEVRQALQASALELGTAGRDTSYGYGLVQAKDALDMMQTSCCAAGTTTTTLPPPTTTTVAGTTTTTLPPPTTTTVAGTTTTTLPPPTTTTVAGTTTTTLPPPTTTTTTTTPPPPTTTTTTGPVTVTEKWACSKNPVDPLTVCQESYSSSAECEAENAETADRVSCGNGPKVCYKYECQGTGPATTTVGPGTTTVGFTTTASPSCDAVGASCTADGDCCSNKCKGPLNGKTCK